MFPLAKIITENIVTEQNLPLSNFFSLSMFFPLAKCFPQQNLSLKILSLNKIFRLAFFPLAIFPLSKMCPLAKFIIENIVTEPKKIRSAKFVT